MNKEDQISSVEEVDRTSLTMKDGGSSITLQRTLSIALRHAWQPIPVGPPEVDPDLPNLPAIQRTAEVFRYKILQLEHAVSPEGGLRAWLKLNVLLSMLIGIPALFLVPLITFLFSAFASWTGFLLQAVLNLLYILLGLLAIGAIIMVVGIVLTRLRIGQIQNAQQDARGNRR